MKKKMQKTLAEKAKKQKEIKSIYQVPRDVLDQVANESLAETKSKSVAQLSERYLRQKMHYDDPKVSDKLLMSQAETLVSLGEELSKEPEIQAQMKIKP